MLEEILLSFSAYRVIAGLNKEEVRKTLSRAVFFNRFGEMHGRSIESQSHRANGLTLVTAAIILWNTVYIERAVEALKEHGQIIDENLLQYLSPLGWEHIILSGDFDWHSGAAERKIARPLHIRPARDWGT